MPRRLTNDLLLALILGLVLSGLFGWALPVAIGWPLYDVHRALGIAVLVVLLVWKQAVIRASLSRRVLRRRPWDRSVLWGAIGATALVLGVLLGLSWTIGLISFDTLWGYSPLNIHVFLGIGLLPFVGWHALRRRRPNRASAPVASRRAAVRLGALAVVSAIGWQVTRLGDRRLTGSKHAASFSANAFPGEIWLFDSVPLIDPAEWRLQLSGLIGSRSLGLAELAQMPRGTVQAVLDCTGGWWTEQVWTGVPLVDVLQMPTHTREVVVESVTGHRVTFAPGEIQDFVLATHVGDEPLSAVHGAPVRLAAPGRRGYQWVKWVSRIDIS